MSDNQYNTQIIEMNPDRPGIDEARLKESGVPVWALVGYLPAVDGDIERLAADYDVPVEEVEAALHYYQQNRIVIDARIAANGPDGRSH